MKNVKLPNAKEIAAIVLAAGRGERMGALGPKALEPLFNRPMIEWVLSSIQQLGISLVMVVIGYQGERLAKFLKGRKGIRCVWQKRQLGTADAVCSALPHVRRYQQLLVLCGDTPLFRAESLARLIQEHQRQKNAVSFLSAEIADPTGYGRVIRQGEYVLKIVEEQECSQQEQKIREINTGAYCFDAELLRQALQGLPQSQSGEYYLTSLIHQWAEQGLAVNAIRLTDSNEGWGVNSFEELVRATEILKNRILDQFRRLGVVVMDPTTTYVAPDAQIGKGTLLYPCTMIESDVVIGEFCHIGPFAHLRAGSRIEDGAEIGNFVEVTRTQIGAKTKAKHLSYLGDARIGAQVNIGAGTITANYNGKGKYQTIIEDQAMIGSNTTLVAPVKIGKKAVTGAGSVILKKKNVPPGAVVVGVPGRLLKERRNGK